MLQNKFKLVHKETGLSLREYKQQYPLLYYSWCGLDSSNKFKDDEIKMILREDGAVGFQRTKPNWDESHLIFLKREDWVVEHKQDKTLDSLIDEYNENKKT